MKRGDFWWFVGNGDGWLIERGEGWLVRRWFVGRLIGEDGMKGASIDNSGIIGDMLLLLFNNEILLLLHWPFNNDKLGVVGRLLLMLCGVQIFLISEMAVLFLLLSLILLILLFLLLFVSLRECFL